MSAPSLSVAERVLWLMSTAACAGVSARLYFLKLHKSYRFFFALLVVHLARNGLLWSLVQGTPAYTLAWSLTLPPLWVLQVLVVLEIYSLVFRSQHGVYTLGRWLLSGALAVSVLLSIISLLPTRVNEPWLSPVHLTVIDRAVSLALAIFVFLIVAFLAWYPIPLSRNIIVHCILYSVFFLSSTMALLVLNVIGKQISRPVSSTLLAISAACLVGWTVLLTREGENKVIVLRSDWSPANEKRLIEQLHTINATLLRAAKRSS